MAVKHHSASFFKRGEMWLARAISDPRVVKALRYARYAPLDLIGSLRPKRDLVPPRRMINVGRGDYVAVGNEFLEHFVTLGGLKPTAAVLEVGCGIGRMARPLTRFLRDGGRYDGIDVDAASIGWCRMNITRRYPHFRFKVANVRNQWYNAQGAISPAEYRLPYDDASYDFAFMTSVVTHMFPGDSENYVRELSRTLKPGGIAFVTYFLWNDEAAELSRKGMALFNFVPYADDQLVCTPKVPERATAFPETKVFTMYDLAGLEIESIHYGTWPGRPKGASTQDIIVARKPFHTAWA